MGIELPRMMNANATVMIVFDRPDEWPGVPEPYTFRAYVQEMLLRPEVDELMAKFVISELRKGQDGETV